MNTLSPRTTIVIALSGLLVLIACGCEDSASKQRDEVQAKLGKIRNDLQKARAGGAETPEAYQTSLTTIVTQLTSLSGGEPGQQAAKSLMAADALREIAAVQMTKAADIESKHRADLGVVNARIDAALRMHALATGMSKVDDGERRGQLQAELQKAKDGVTALQARLGELQAPINERTAQNQSQKQDIERMRVQVNELLKKAQEKGYSAGFQTYKQATEIGRQADKIEYEVSQREIDLEHDLNPQQKMAQTQKAQLEAMVQAIEAAQGELDAYATAASGDAHASQTKAAELSKQVSDDLAKIKSESDGALKTSYDEAESALEKSAVNAQNAAKGSDASGAKMTAAAAAESTACLHLSAARGLADREATLQRIKNSQGAISVNGTDAQLQELATARKQQEDAAKAALDSAKQSLEAAGGNGAEVEVFRRNLQMLDDAMSGKTAAPESPAAAPSGTEASGGATLQRGDGAESAEALVAALNSVKTSADMKTLFDVGLPPSDAGALKMLEGARTLSAAMGQLDAALHAKFNKGIKDIPNFGGGMTGDLPLIAEAKALKVEGATGTVAISFENGKNATVEISQVGERWYVGKEGDNGAGMLASLQMSQDEIAAAAPMVQQMIGVMSRALSDLAKAVRAGEFATFEDFQAKATARMTQVIQGAMGGMTPPGGGARPSTPPRPGGGAPAANPEK